MYRDTVAISAYLSIPPQRGGRSKRSFQSERPLPSFFEHERMATDRIETNLMPLIGAWGIPSSSSVCLDERSVEDSSRESLAFR